MTGLWQAFCKPLARGGTRGSPRLTPACEQTRWPARPQRRSRRETRSKTGSAAPGNGCRSRRSWASAAKAPRWERPAGPAGKPQACRGGMVMLRRPAFPSPSVTGPTTCRCAAGPRPRNGRSSPRRRAPNRGAIRSQGRCRSPPRNRSVRTHSRGRCAPPGRVAGVAPAWPGPRRRNAAGPGAGDRSGRWSAALPASN